MAEKIFNQEFNGYWLESGISNLPKVSGVYIVQSCLYNKEMKEVNLKRLIYIGKADNILERVSSHEKLEDWEKELKEGEQLCYSYTKINATYNNRVEAALININQPIVNIEYKKAFPFDTTIVNSRKTYSLLKEKIEVKRH
ncbi:GIY-YIG nuclease family protein [Tenacibaculum halocynthiae]|uniref:hypothetical protein n=1 Tax=Tenacibaculum halocynthiae TaxID=1254437 RepID=UPI0026029387|nr:hypothetical protein [uncultured Tenacibaculum sp.]